MLAYAITTFNEASNITACIDRLRAAGVSQAAIYVIDSLSTDGTQELARAKGATVFENPFVDMASQRNFAFAEIGSHSGDIQFVCILDADERVTPAFHEELNNLIINRCDKSESTAVAVCRQMIFNGYWVKRASNFPVFIDRVGHIRSTTWHNLGHGEILKAEHRLKINEPLREEDQKGIESLLRRHVTYARDEARFPVETGDQSWLKRRLKSMRGGHILVFLYFLFLFLGKGIVFRDRRERDYALVKVMYELQIVLFKRYT